jgi:hypothetical protein
VTSTQPKPGTACSWKQTWRFIHEYYTGMAAVMLDKAFPRGYPMRDAESVVVFETTARTSTRAPRTCAWARPQHARHAAGAARLRRRPRLQMPPHAHRRGGARRRRHQRGRSSRTR